MNTDKLFFLDIEALYPSYLLSSNGEIWSQNREIVEKTIRELMRK